MKYTYAIDTKELQEFTHNDFIYNLAKDLCIKANKEDKTNKMYISEKQYYCLDKYSQFDGKRNYYITKDKKYLIILHRGAKQGKPFYFISTKRQHPNNPLQELLAKDKDAIAVIKIKEKSNKINTFTLLSLDYLDDLKEEEKEGYIEILELIYK